MKNKNAKSIPFNYVLKTTVFHLVVENGWIQKTLKNFIEKIIYSCKSIPRDNVSFQIFENLFNSRKIGFSCLGQRYWKNNC